MTKVARMVCIKHGGNPILIDKNFYIASNSSIFSGIGYIPICKKCLYEMVEDYYKKDGDLKLAIYHICSKIDVGFSSILYDGAIKNSKNSATKTLQHYMRQYNSLASFKDEQLPFDDGEHIDIYATTAKTNNEVNDGIDNYKNLILQNLTQDDLDKLEDKWGIGYQPEEYIAFEKKWNKLIDNYGQKTALHVEGLKTYIRFRVKEEFATAKGDVNDSKKWGELASKASSDAKINVSQLSKSDISGGVDVLSQVFEAVESEVGVISQLPKVLEQPYDDADIIIWCIINYARRLEDKPRVTYREIWDFYDKFLKEFCKQKGYNEEQIEDFIAKRQVPYRDMSKLYVEPIYNENEDTNEVGDENNADL